MSAAPKLGIWSWSFVGFVAATVIVVIAFGAVSEIVLPLLFAAVLAVVFKPLVGYLGRHGLKPTLGAGLVVLGLLALMTLVVVATVHGVIQQTDEIGVSFDAAIDKAVEELNIDEDALNDARAAAEETSPAVAEGFVTRVVSGVNALIGLASGVILGSLIMYYLLKDGTSIRRALVRQAALRSGTRSTRSSPTRSTPSAATGGAGPPCRRSLRWLSASRASCSAFRSYSPSLS